MNKRPKSLKIIILLTVVAIICVVSTQVALGSPYDLTGKDQVVGLQYTSGFTENASSYYAPSEIAYDSSNGDIYVTNYLASSVSVINGNDYSLIKTINVGSFPYGIVYDSSNGCIYVANENSSYISVINGGTNRVVDNISVYRAWDLAYDTSNNNIYAISERGITIINGSSNVVTDIITAGSEPSAITYDPLDARIYVANYISDNITVINSNNNSVAGWIQIGAPFNLSNPSGPVGIAVDTSNGLIYVSINTHYVYLINATNNAVIGNISTGSYLQGITYDPTNGDIYVVSETTPGHVSVINGTSNKVIDNITVGNDPIGIVIDNPSGRIFVSNQNDNTITIINGAINVVSMTVSVVPGISGTISNFFSNFQLSYTTLGYVALIVIAVTVAYLVVKARKKK